MLRTIQLTAVVLLLCLILAPAAAEAGSGWNRAMRFFGEFWSDGYHSPGDYWNQPPHHPPRVPAYQPYYPVMPQPTQALPAPGMPMEETISTPIIEYPPVIRGVPSK
ncbi:hypothetical protein [Bremerella cremea]|uniref:hypothetical protein n=1 Tax=Bremerella cremea TaxID=1031537 RepID=UPI0011C0485C|nr:hypothetical protein [Bremerella cremea]